jgi:glyoxylase-like metal-dependent hydrolase (beta-lactamase superfamily II)
MVDIFKLQHGRIVEHCDVTQSIPEAAEHPESDVLTAAHRRDLTRGRSYQSTSQRMQQMSYQNSSTTKIPDVRDIAPGVRQVAVGAPFLSYVYLLDSPEGIVAFDAGVRGSGPEILAAAGGPIAKVILSHAHADHRGAAPELGAPIYCHRDEVADTQADWPQSYLDFSQIQNQRIREGLYRLNQTWDSGPLEIAGTIEEGDEVAGMQVIHVPGHAPGEIALFRPSDRLLLAADAIYTQDAETGQPAPARVPNHFANWNTEQARASIRKLATYKPTSVWLGHSTSITGDVEAQLAAAASSDDLS